MIKNIIQTLFTRGFVAIINLLFLIVSSRYLGVNTRGEISLFVLNIATIQIINEIYTGYSLVYFVPKFDLKKIVINGFIWTLIATSFSNVLLYFSDKGIRGFETDMFVLSLMIILNTFNMVILLAKQKIRLYNFLSVSQPLLLLCGLSFSVLFAKEYTFRAYVIPQYLSFGVSFLISSIAVIKCISAGDMKKEFSFSPIFKNGFFCQMGVLMGLLSNRLSFYILNSTALVGLYSTASSLIESVWIIANGVTPIVLSKVANTGDSPANQRLILSIAKACFLLSALAVGVICLLPASLFTNWLGQDFAPTKQIMLWLIPGILTVSFSTVIIHYYSGLGNYRLIALCNLAGFLFTVSGGPFLIGKYELWGAAMTANLSYLIAAIAIFFVFLAKTRFGIKELFGLKEDIKNLRQAFHA
jgi:O-antigen/teichoic acid export membrane protein